MADYEHLVTAEQLAGRPGDDNWRVVDCRFDLMAPEKGFEDYLAGHIPGAVYANLDVDLAAPVTAATGRHPLPEIDTFVARLGSWGIDESTQVVVYDQGNGAIAARLWWMLNWLGHTSVAILDGGLEAWQRIGGGLETAQPAVPPRSFLARPAADMVIESEELVGLLGGSTPFTLVDAREQARFVGDVEPIDSVAGHIPGAVNFPLGTSMTAEGNWKDVAQLRQAWLELLERAPEGGWAVMCGSGVTACHIALSARIAGLGTPRLYIGSWSEWIRDSGRPVATGAASGSAD